MEWEDLIKSGEAAELGMAYESAAGFYEQATHHEEGRYHGLRRLGALRLKTGEVPASLEYNRLTVQANPQDYLAASSMLYAQQCLPESTPEQIFKSHREWARIFTSALQQFPLRPEVPKANRKLKIGFISPDFSQRHPLLYFLKPIIQGLNRNEFELYLYSAGQYPDETTRQMLALADVPCQFLPENQPEASYRIWQDQLDLLVDLSGHSSNHVLLIMGTRPCRRQATYLGYPNTTGLSQVDFRIVDHYSDPPGLTDPWHTERLMRLPDCAWCFAPGSSLPFDPTPPSEKTGRITFGCFNNLAKFSSPILESWRALLEAVPDSRLLIKAGAFTTIEGRDRFTQRLDSLGFPREQVDLAPSVAYEDHLAMYRQIDVALDTFPYHGTTTTCEALWMGVPVVTLAGSTHISRVGVSLLRQAGLETLIAHSPSEYVAKAIDLVSDSDRLRDYHRGLRETLQNSTLMNPRRFLPDFENLLRQLTDEPVRV